MSRGVVSHVTGPARGGADGVEEAGVLRTARDPSREGSHRGVRRLGIARTQVREQVAREHPVLDLVGEPEHDRDRARAQRRGRIRTAQRRVHLASHGLGVAALDLVTEEILRGVGIARCREPREELVTFRGHRSPS